MGEPKRDRWGRYVLPDPETGEERSWVRATTIAGLLDDRYNIERWGQRMVAVGLAQRPDLFALAKAYAKDAEGNKRRLNGLVKDAVEAGGGSKASNIGTAIHAYTEALDRGEVVDAPPPYDRDVEAYGVVLDSLGIDVVPGWVERIVVTPQLGEGIAGTLDRLVTVQGWDLPVIADVKTGKSVHFATLAHAIQQAIYANSTHVWDEDEERLVPMPEVDRRRALIVHLPAGQARCEVHVLDIEQGWVFAQTAAAVRQARQAKDLSTTLG